MVMELLQKQLLLVVNEVVEEVQLSMNKSLEIADIVATLPDVTRVFDKNITEEETRRRLKEVQETIAVISAQHADSESILLFGADGDIAASSTGVRGSIAAKSYYPEVMAGSLSMGTTEDLISGEMLPYLAAPILEKGKIVGGVVIYVNHKSMFNRWSERIKQDPQARLQILDKNKAPLFYVWGDSFNGPQNQEASIRRVYDVFFQQPEKTLISYTTDSHRVGMHATVPGLNWVVLLTNDEAYFFHGTTKLFYRAVVFAFIVALIMLGLVTLLIRKLIIRLERAHEDVTRITSTIPGAVVKLKISSDGKFQLLYANSAFYDLTGYSPAEVEENLHNDLTSIILPEDLPNLRSILAESVASNSHPTVEARAIRKDGTIYWTSTRASYIVEPQGDILLDAVLLDITDIKEAQETLREQKYILEKLVEERTTSLAASEASSRQEKALLRSIFHHIPDFIYYKDLEGYYIGCNKACAEFFGVPEAEVQGKTDHILFAKNPEIAEQCLRQDALVCETMEPLLHIEEESITAEGKHIFLETTKVMFTDAEGVPLGLVGISRDVTDRVLTTQELHKSKEEAQAANKAKSEFLANMSHEIRTPLNGIIGMNHLAQQADPSPRIQGYLIKMETSAKNLLSIINEILDFSKIEAGRIELENQPFTLQAVLASLEDMFAPMAEKKGLSLIMPPAEQCKAFFPLKGDDLRLGQVLINLLSNAIKFTEKGQIEVKATTSRMDNGRILLEASVSDTGIGLSKENIGRLFSSFAQADSSITRRFGGTGLGLAISKALLELMDGSIRVESEEGVGSTFFITACFDTPPEGTAMPLIHHLPFRQSEKIDFHGLRVLLVEDNEINQMIAQEMLSMKGCIVDVANNGVEAVTKVEHAPYNLILMDIQMPYMDGFEATRRIRQTHTDVPIVAMTAHAMQEDREKSLAAGMQDHISKPIDPDKLYHVMERVLGLAEHLPPV